MSDPNILSICTTLRRNIVTDISSWQEKWMKNKFQTFYRRWPLNVAHNSQSCKSNVNHKPNRLKVSSRHQGFGAYWLQISFLTSGWHSFCSAFNVWNKKPLCVTIAISFSFLVHSLQNPKPPIKLSFVSDKPNGDHSHSTCNREVQQYKAPDNIWCQLLLSKRTVTRKLRECFPKFQVLHNLWKRSVFFLDL